MSGIKTGIFADWAPTYRSLGFWPRPITPGSKACHVKGWQKPDTDIDAAELNDWLKSYASHGIGLLMGSSFPDGTRLGALDIDRDEYVSFGDALLRQPTCGRIGKKGVALLVRVTGAVRAHPKFKIAGSAAAIWGQVAECLFDKTLCVIPPTQHPDTKAPYRWTGVPLHEVDYRTLPIIGE